jgi:hypothetical protein
MIRSKKITGAARGEECTLQISGFCNGNPETVVFCHFPDNETHGMGIKSCDLSGGFGCSSCHDVVDKRVKGGAFSKVEMDWYMRRSQSRTLRRLFELGVLKVA